MHSRIFQIADTQIEEDNFIDEMTIEVGATTSVDYTAEISEDERRLAIECLVNEWLPTGMFSLGTEPDTLVYNGGLDEWVRNEWLPKIRKSAEILSTHNIFQNLNITRMKQLLNNALGIGTLFYLAAENYQSFAEHSTAFIEYLNNFSAGQIFYIGGVLDYHW